MLDEQEVIRAPAAFVFRPGQVGGGLPLGVGGVPGDHRAVQAHRVQQLPDLGDLVGVLGDRVLGDDHLFLVQHRGEQLHLLSVPDPAQPLAVDRDRPQQPVQAPGTGQRPQPAAGDLVQLRRVDLLEQGADPFLTRRDDLPQQRVRPSAEPA